MQSTSDRLSTPVDEILLPAQAAAFLGVTEEQLHNAVCQGYLPGACIDGQWRFSQSALIDALRVQRFAVDSPPELVLDPASDYAEAWSTCIKMRRVIETVQKLMLAGHNIHDLVDSPYFKRVYETYREFYEQTEAREEELGYQIFKDIEQWVKTARSYYWNYELSLSTSITAVSYTHLTLPTIYSV